MAPASQELQLRRAGVPRDHIYRDVGASGSTGTQERRGWHRLNGRLAGRDTLVVVAIDRIGRRWPDTIRSICELRDLGGKDPLPGRNRCWYYRDGPPIYKIMEAPDCEPARAGIDPQGTMERGSHSRFPRTSGVVLADQRQLPALVGIPDGLPVRPPCGESLLQGGGVEGPVLLQQFIELPVPAPGEAEGHLPGFRVNRHFTHLSRMTNTCPWPGITKAARGQTPLAASTLTRRTAVSRAAPVGRGTGIVSCTGQTPCRRREFAQDAEGI